MVRITTALWVPALQSYAAALTAVLLLFSFCCDGDVAETVVPEKAAAAAAAVCDEIYLVKEGETLHTISEKCGDPYIVEENPHIHDPDDVFPGLVIKITPFNFKS